MNAFILQFKNQTRHHAVLYVIIFMYFLGFVLIGFLKKLTFNYSTGLFFIEYCVMILIIFCLIALFVQTIKLMRRRAERPIRHLITWSHTQMLKNERFSNGIHGIIILGSTIFIFSTIKTAIPYIQPFVWDKSFMQLDRALFLGVDPWVALQPILGSPYTTTVLSLFYNIWITVIAFVIAFALFSKGTALRLQFILSCILSWIISGNIIAIMLSSAGPCYYGFIVDGMNPYAAQMEYLRQADKLTGMVFTLQVQDLLWSSYLSSGGTISGISAMPSLHIIFALLLSFYVTKINRAVGLALAAYAAIIFIGSVHLAWHYAVDGVAALLLASMTWYVSGRIVKSKAVSYL